MLLYKYCYILTVLSCVIIYIYIYIEGYCWARTAERQASTMRAKYLKAVLRQDVEYFDLKVGSTNEVITSVSSDSLVIQDVLSEKVSVQFFSFSPNANEICTFYVLYFSER